MAAHDVQDVHVECRKSFSREDAKAAKKRRQEFGGGLDGASCKPMLETNMGHPTYLLQGFNVFQKNDRYQTQGEKSQISISDDFLPLRPFASSAVNPVISSKCHPPVKPNPGMNFLTETQRHGGVWSEKKCHSKQWLCRA